MTVKFDNIAYGDKIAHQSVFLHSDVVHIVEQELVHQQDGLLFLPIVLEADDGFARVNDLLDLPGDTENVAIIVVGAHFKRLSERKRL
jgi:hypothetical protein